MTKAEQLADTLSFSNKTSVIEEAIAELRRLATMEARVKELEDALRGAYGDIQRCPTHTIDMLGRIEAALGATK